MPRRRRQSLLRVRVMEVVKVPENRGVVGPFIHRLGPKNNIQSQHLHITSNECTSGCYEKERPDDSRHCADRKEQTHISLGCAETVLCCNFDYAHAPESRKNIEDDRT